MLYTLEVVATATRGTHKIPEVIIHMTLEDDYVNLGVGCFFDFDETFVFTGSKGASERHGKLGWADFKPSRAGRRGEGGGGGNGIKRT